MDCERMLLMKTHTKTERSNEPADLDLKIRYQKVETLKPYPGNARGMSRSMLKM